MGRTIADLRSQFGAAANIVAHVQYALRVAGFIHQSASGDQPPRPNELADCIRTLHQDLLAAKAEAADRTSYAAELEERVAGLERGAKVREEAADLAAADANALMAIHNILTRHGANVGTDLVGVVQGVATELERRDERVKELEGQLAALTEAAESRDKVSRLVADLRDHSLHGQLEALQAEELRLLRIIARLVDGQQ
jgi:cell division septum initiation protein DivIVA